MLKFPNTCEMAGVEALLFQITDIRAGASQPERKIQCRIGRKKSLPPVSALGQDDL